MIKASCGVHHCLYLILLNHKNSSAQSLCNTDRCLYPADSLPVPSKRTASLGEEDSKSEQRSEQSWVILEEFRGF